MVLFMQRKLFSRVIVLSNVVWVQQISFLWPKSDGSMSSCGASSGKSVLLLVYRSVYTRWRQKGILANKHTAAEKAQPAEPTRSNWTAMGDQYNIPALSTLTNDITVVSFHYVIMKESPCTVSGGTINLDSVALPFFPLWHWKYTDQIHENRQSKTELNDRKCLYIS